VRLTADGEALLPFLRRVMSDVEAAGAEARALSGMARGRLSVGATPSLITRVLAPALVEFHASHPGIELLVVEAGSRQLVPQLAGGEVDLALVVLPVHDPLVATTPLFDDPLVLAVAPGHPLAARASVGVGDLHGLALVMFREGYDLRSVTLAACRAVGAEPHLVSQGGEMDGVLAFVAAGLGAAVVPAIALPSDHRVSAVPFADPGIRRTVALAQRNDRALPRPAQALADQLTAATAAGHPPADPACSSGV
jgi:DNA-binding transcriptional LysR family regulator